MQFKLVAITPVLAAALLLAKAANACCKKISKWSDIGIQIPDCKSDEIVVASRHNNSGTYAYFKQAVLGDKGYMDWILSDAGQCILIKKVLPRPTTLSATECDGVSIWPRKTLAGH